MERYKTIHENKVLINPPSKPKVIKKKMLEILKKNKKWK
jgi:hypothetical protein